MERSKESPPCCVFLSNTTGSGCPMFADKTLLDSSRYVKDETIFVKIIVDTKSLMAPDSDRL